MKERYVTGGLTIAFGVFWIVGITFGMITDVLPVSLQHPLAWAQQIYLPASAVSTLLYIGFLLAWVYYSYNKRCANSLEARQTISIWLSLFGMALISNIIVLVLFIQFTVVQAPASQATLGGASFVNAPPYEFLIPLTLVNGLLLFWLPTCFLSQRTLRFVPPMSYELNTLTEKR